jgi:hypothetical protein
MKITITILILFLSPFVAAQSIFTQGYIEFNNKDTIHGEISLSSHGLYFRKNISSIEQIYSANQIQTVRFLSGNEYIGRAMQLDITPLANENIYVGKDSSIYKKDTIFIRLIVKGAASLYEYEDKRNDLFFILKGDTFEQLIYHRFYLNRNGVNYLSENKKFVQQLSVYFSDCPSLQSSFDHLDFNSSSLQNIFTRYDQCEQGGPYYTAKKPASSFYFGFSAGIMNTQISFTGNSDYFLTRASFSSSTNPCFGINILFLPKYHSLLSLYADLLYTSFDSKGFYQGVSYPNFPSLNYYSLDFSYIKLNTLARINFRQSSISLTLLRKSTFVC